MSTANPITAYAWPAFRGATGLYRDARRRRFLSTSNRTLTEGELVEVHGATYRVTWAEAEAARGEAGRSPEAIDLCNERCGAQRVAA